MTGPLILGIDLGGTKILAAVATPEGKLLGRQPVSTLAHQRRPDAMATQAGHHMQVVDQVAAGVIGVGETGEETGKGIIDGRDQNQPTWLQ